MPSPFQRPDACRNPDGGESNIELNKSIKSLSSWYLSISPNPSNGLFTANVTNLDKSVSTTINVFNVLGELIYSVEKSFDSTFEIDISNYANGVYYVKGTSSTGQIETVKIIKQ